MDFANLVAKIRVEGTEDANSAIAQFVQTMRKMSDGIGVTAMASVGGIASPVIAGAFTAITAAAAAATAAVVGLGAASVKVAADIQQGFVDVKKYTGLAGAEFEQLADGIRGLGSEMAGVSIAELQQIAATAGQLGVEGQANILNFTRVVAMMAATSDMTASAAADGFAQILNATKLPTSALERVADAITNTAAVSVAAEGDLVTLTKLMAGVGTTFGLTVDQVVGLGGALKDAGINAEVGTTAMNDVMITMLKASSEGGASLQIMADVAGMSAKQFADAIKNEPMAALQEFIKGLGGLEKTNAAEVLDELGMDGTRVTSVLLALGNTSQKLSEDLEAARKGFEEGGQTAKEFEEGTKSLWAQLEKLKNNILLIVEAFGEKLLPSITGIIESLSLLAPLIADAISKLTESGIEVAASAWEVLADAILKVSDALMLIGPKAAILGAVAKGGVLGVDAAREMVGKAFDAAKMAAQARKALFGPKVGEEVQKEKAKEGPKRKLELFNKEDQKAAKDFFKGMQKEAEDFAGAWDKMVDDMDRRRDQFVRHLAGKIARRGPGEFKSQSFSPASYLAEMQSRALSPEKTQTQLLTEAVKELKQEAADMAFVRRWLDQNPAMLRFAN